MRGIAAVALGLMLAAQAVAHRLDEYLQGTIFTIEKNRVAAQVVLTPGVAVLPWVMAEIDADGNGAISEAEQRAYAGRLLKDLSLTVDGRVLKPRLSAVRFPSATDMKEGRGEIQVEFNADLPSGGHIRRLTFENRHEQRIAAYQVNCLVPADRDVKIIRQTRNYSQSVYELEYEQAGVDAAGLGWLGALGVVVLIACRIGFLRV